MTSDTHKIPKNEGDPNQLTATTAYHEAGHA